LCFIDFYSANVRYAPIIRHLNNSTCNTAREIYHSGGSE